jgi:hypothetical protein
MGQGNVRTAMTYRHAARGIDEMITNAIDRQLGTRDEDGDGGEADAPILAG